MVRLPNPEDSILANEVCIATYTKGDQNMKIVDSLGEVYLNFKTAAHHMAYQKRM